MLAKGIKQKDKTVIVLLVLIAAALVFIWGNSLESREISSGKSALLLKTLSFVLEPVFGKGNITDHLIRKLAHFMEFGLLGVLLSLYATMRGRTKVQSVLNCMFFCLAAAVADEAIQLISARGSQVADVLLDFTGAVLGILTVIIWKWLRAISQKTKSAKGLTDRA